MSPMSEEPSPPADDDARAAADPQTPVTELARLAAERPDLHLALATNPATYEDLVRWLASSPDPQIAQAAQARRSQVRTVDRSERIRTYNFPENRIADHRTGYKAYNLDAVLDGDLGPVVASAIELDEAERLAAASERA